MVCLLPSSDTVSVYVTVIIFQLLQGALPACLSPGDASAYHPKHRLAAVVAEVVFALASQQFALR